MAKLLVLKEMAKHINMSSSLVVLFSLYLAYFRLGEVSFIVPLYNVLLMSVSKQQFTIIQLQL